MSVEDFLVKNVGCSTHLRYSMYL